jgi:hypothetical protein
MKTFPVAKRGKDSDGVGEAGEVVACGKMAVRESEG